MHRRELIQAYIDKLGAQTYLEIGVQRAHLFRQIKAPRKIAVDPNFMLSKTTRVQRLLFERNDTYCEQTSDEFFATKADTLFANQPIDVAFVDGLHTYAQVVADVTNILRHLAPNGVILLHDCNPVTEASAVYAMSPADAMERYPGWASGVWLGDVYKAIIEFRATLHDRHVFVFDTDHGVGCIQPGEPQDVLKVAPQEIASMTYAQFDADRDRLINLRPVSYLPQALQLLD